MPLRHLIQFAARPRQSSGCYRKPGDEGQVMLLAVLQHVLVLPVSHVVLVLHADDLDHFAGTIDLLGLYLAQPKVPNLPWLCSRAIAPSDSSTGTFASMRCNCQRSITSVFSQRKLISTCWTRYSGRPTWIHWSGPWRVKPALVATTRPWGKGESASPINRSLTTGP